MGKDKARKVRKEKKYTRMQAERALTAGMDPEMFVKHPNYHVKKKAWKKMGMPLPDDAGERVKFLASIHVKEKPVAAPVEEMAANPASDTP